MRLIEFFVACSLICLISCKRFDDVKTDLNERYFENLNFIKNSNKCAVLNRLCDSIEDDLDALECAYTFKVG